MNYPFDNDMPLHAQHPSSSSTRHQQSHMSQAPTCVIHYASINSHGNILVQIHSDQPNGQRHVQSDYVAPSSLKSFVQQLQQQHPNINILQQQTAHDANTQSVSHNDMHRLSTVASPAHNQMQNHSNTNNTLQPYDKYGSSFGACAQLADNAQVPYSNMQSSAQRMPLSGNPDPNQDPNC